MSHCPQCGKPPPEGANACPFCGFRYAGAPGAKTAAGRTMLGVAGDDAAAVRRAAAARAEGAGASKASRTIVGMPARSLPAGGATAPLGTPSQANRTLLGVARSPAAT